MTRPRGFQIPTGTTHVPRRYEEKLEAEYQALEAGLSIRKIRVREEPSQAVEQILFEAGEYQGRIMYQSSLKLLVAHEDLLLLEAQHVHRMSLEEISDLTHIPATRLSDRTRDARMRVTLLLKFGAAMPLAALFCLGLDNSEAYLTQLLYSFSIVKVAEISCRALGPKDAWSEGSKIKTAACRLIERIEGLLAAAYDDDCIDFEGNQVSHPVVAILRRRLEEYNRNTRKNNKEDWVALRDHLAEKTRSVAAA